MGQFFTVFLIHPLINLLLLIYQLLFWLHVPFALGFAIILLTILIRLILYPLTASQLKTSQQMQHINPHLSKLREKHKHDAKRLQQETMALYKEYGINPASGCLSLIIQLPLLYSLYAVLQDVVKLKPVDVVSFINHIAYFPFLHLTRPWDPSFFGLLLAQSPAALMKTHGPLLLLLPLITGALQFYQTRQMFPKPAVQAKEKKKTSTQDDIASAFQTQSLYIFPVMIALFSYSLPFGLTLYWNTFTIFAIIQQYQIQASKAAVKGKQLKK
jgi:YidC/Oxa1 family membrane protein insertase